MHLDYRVNDPSTNQWVDVIHIAEFAARTHLNQATVRDMLNRTEPGTVAGTRFRRPLKHIRDDSTVWVYKSEVEEYPVIRGTNCYHFNIATNQFELCVECTMGSGCEKSTGKEIKSKV